MSLSDPQVSFKHSRSRSIVHDNLSIYHVVHYSPMTLSAFFLRRLLFSIDSESLPPRVGVFIPPVLDIYLYTVAILSNNMARNMVGMSKGCRPKNEKKQQNE